MKVCPRCGRDYVDELDFCLEDGTPLSVSEKITERKTEQFGEPTFVQSAQTVSASEPTSPARSSNKLGVILVVGSLLLGILVILGAGLAGIWFYLARRNDITRPANSNQGNISSTTNLKLSNNAIVFNGNVQLSPSPAANVPNRTPGVSPTPGNSANRNKPSVPKTISGGMLNAKAISLPKPPYPLAARAVQASGTVSVQVMIDEKGNVISATAVSGHPLLRAAAVEAARAARFSPTLLSGQPVKVSGVINYNFVP